MRCSTAALFVLLGLALAATPVLAKKPGGPPGHAKVTKIDNAAKAAKFERGVAKKHKVKFKGFSQTDRDVVRAYFVANPGHYYYALPPGIAMNYARGKPLPPGIAKKVQPLPPALLAQLPVRPGHVYVVVGSDVVLINAATKLVVDIIGKVFN